MKRRWQAVPEAVVATIAVGGLIWALASAITSTHHTAKAVTDLKAEHKEDVREIKAGMRQANTELQRANTELAKQTVLLEQLLKGK